MESPMVVHGMEHHPVHNMVSGVLIPEGVKRRVVNHTISSEENFDVVHIGVKPAGVFNIPQHALVFDFKIKKIPFMKQIVTL